jgi:hypothetical protein
MSEEPEQNWDGPERRQPHPAPRSRKTLKWVIVAGAVGGFGILLYLNVLLQRVIDKAQPVAPQDIASLARWLRVMSVVMGLSMLGVAVWIAHFSWRVSTTAVYPPPGSRHIKPKRVLRGRVARTAALAGYLFAAVLGSAGVALVPVVWRLLKRIAGT